MTLTAPRVVIFRVPGAESAANADRLASTAAKAGLDVLIAPYWPDGFECSSAPQSPLLEQDIGSADRLSAFAFREAFGFDLDLPDLSAHLFATERLTPDLVLPESIWSQHLRGVAQRAARYLDEAHADLVFVPHGAEVVSRLLAEMTVATRRRLLFWESAFFPGFHYVDPHAPHFFRGECRLDRLSPPEVPIAGVAFINQWRRERASKYPQNTAPSERLALQQWAAADPRPTVFLAGQIATDANAVVGLGSRDSLGEIYNSALSAIPQDWRIIYKPHPLAHQDVLHTWEAPSQRFIKTTADIHDVFEVSDAVLAYSSNVGLEALLAGLPVILFGRPIYSGRGLTYDLTEPEALNDLLAQPLSPPDPTAIAAFTELMLTEGLTRDDDPAALLRRIDEAGFRPQPPRLSWYGEPVQAIGHAAQALTAALASNETLDQAMASLPEVHRTTLLARLNSTDLAQHLFGGPRAPRGHLAPRPQPDIARDLIHTDLKLENSTDPARALSKAAAQAGPTAALCFSLPSWAACPPEAIQRLTLDDIRSIGARCDPPREVLVLGLDGDRLTLPDGASASVWVGLATTLNQTQFPNVGDKTFPGTTFRSWRIPAAAFSYSGPTPMTAKVCINIEPGDPTIYGPYVSVPPGKWLVSWRIRPKSLLRHLIWWLRRTQIVKDVVEHRDGQISVIARTLSTSSSLAFDSVQGARYEFRVSNPRKSATMMTFSGINLHAVNVSGNSNL